MGRGGSELDESQLTVKSLADNPIPVKCLTDFCEDSLLFR